MTVTGVVDGTVADTYGFIETGVFAGASVPMAAGAVV